MKRWRIYRSVIREAITFWQGFNRFLTTPEADESIRPLFSHSVHLQSEISHAASFSLILLQLNIR